MHPSEEHLRKEAKRLARDVGIQLAAAQRQLAHEYGYANWAALIAVVQRMSASSGSSGDSDDSQSAASAPPAPDYAADLLPVLPLRGLVAFPHVSFPIFVGRRTSINAVEEAERLKLPILIVAQKDPSEEKASNANLYDVGVLSTLAQLMRLPDGTMRTIIEGKRRVRVSDFTTIEGRSRARARELVERTVEHATIESLLNLVISSFLKRRGYEVDQLNEEGAQTRARLVQNVSFSIPATIADGASVISDRIASEISISLEQKQALLETLDPAVRLEKLLGHLTATA